PLADPAGDLRRWSAPVCGAHVERVVARSRRSRVPSSARCDVRRRRRRLPGHPDDRFGRARLPPRHLLAAVAEALPTDHAPRRHSLLCRGAPATERDARGALRRRRPNAPGRQSPGADHRAGPRPCTLATNAARAPFHSASRALQPLCVSGPSSRGTDAGDQPEAHGFSSAVLYVVCFGGGLIGLVELLTWRLMLPSYDRVLRALYL